MWDNTKKLQTEFIIGQKEVTEDIYNNMLGALPPVEMCSNAFLVGEPYDHNKHGNARYELYFIKDNKYYSGGLCDVEDFRTFLIPNN